MRSLALLLTIIGLSTAPAFAQSDQSIRAEVEKIVMSHVENFDKQNAAEVAALYTDGVTLVNRAGAQTAEDNLKNAFKAGSLIRR